MSNENIEFIIVAIFILLIFGMAFIACFLSVKMENDHELKKLGILKPKNQVINFNPDYNEKIKYQIKSWSITIVAIVIICLICKLFGFSINDIADLLK